MEFNQVTSFPKTVSAMTLESLWIGNNFIEYLPHQLGRVTTLTDLSYGNNPLKYPPKQAQAKGFREVLWWCRKEGHELKRGGPPKLNLIRQGVGNETGMFETDFIKMLRAKVAESQRTGLMDLSFRNISVRSMSGVSLLHQLPADKTEYALSNLCAGRWSQGHEAVVACPRHQDSPVGGQRAGGGAVANQRAVVSHELDPALVRGRSVLVLASMVHLFRVLRWLPYHRNGIKTLPREMNRLVNLTELDLNDNWIKAMPRGYTKLVNLKVGCGWRDCCRSLESSHTRMKQRLHLARNRLSELPKIERLTKLEYLDCSLNRIKKLSYSIEQLSRLTHLNLGRNKIAVLPSSLSGLVSLTELFLHRNRLKSLPSSIGQVPKLAFLRLGFNRYAWRDTGLLHRLR